MLTFENDVTNHEGATISGNGDIVVASGADFINNGIISPGDLAGRMTFEGIYQQGSTGRLVMEIGGADPSAYDRIYVNGDILLDGLLELSLIDDFTPEASDVFTIDDGDGGLTGFFSNAGEDFAIGFRVASIPEPAGVTLCLAGMMILAP